MSDKLKLLTKGHAIENKTEDFFSSLERNEVFGFSGYFDLNLVKMLAAQVGVRVGTCPKSRPEAAQYSREFLAKVTSIGKLPVPKDSRGPA